PSIALTALAVLGAGFLLSTCGEGRAGYGGSAGPRAAAEPEDPVVFNQLADFELTAHTGRSITRADLAGRPWVVSCIFTTCTGPCPSITRTMQALTGRLEETDAGFLSITVDPERDTPEVLARYAEAFGAKGDWLFLTGAGEAEVHELLRSSFAMTVARGDGTGPEGITLTHSSHLAVIDGQGRVRGWYDSQDPAEVRRLVERVRFLAGDS
ncbi:MAG: SCO family protein, partial [Planctomycetota bacterium]|nr:SCO family protein [Planctomycetota bacterium]